MRRDANINRSIYENIRSDEMGLCVAILITPITRKIPTPIPTVRMRVIGAIPIDFT
jgi:hypothetical protein